ncbi:hypothetical protein ACIQPT_21280 [Streptomyces sp. NPDC091289]|uniref:hypothetical protein n=1 Tax=Streptomyces sp. NPDC091289 TaxID=3365989 RepID=UPI0038242744
MKSGGRWWRRRTVLASALAGAVLISGGGLWAKDSGLFRDRYCWDAWQQDSGARFLGDDALGKSGSERSAVESGTPGADGKTATCTLTVASSVPDDDSDEPIRFDDRVTLSYGPVPEAPGKRRDWIERYFSGTASPLPDGLDGLVAEDRAMLILPEPCDVRGRPSAVTLWAESWGDGHLGKRQLSIGIGDLPDVGRMLLGAAEAGMRKAGCAPDEPLRMTSPMTRVAERPDSAGTPVCRIPGATFDLGKGSRYEEQVGVVDDRLQTCSVVWSQRGVPDEPAAQFVMAATPRTVAVFDGLPEGVEHGLVRTSCVDRDTVFYVRIGSALSGTEKSDRRVVAGFAEAAGRRIGCEPTTEGRGTTR